jgi:hypothetical protein
MRERRNELTGCQQIVAKMNRQRLHAHVRHVEAACAKRFPAGRVPAPEGVGFVTEITGVFIVSRVAKLGGREAAVSEKRVGGYSLSLCPPQERLGW